jgi:hypothetical protein
MSRKKKKKKKGEYFVLLLEIGLGAGVWLDFWPQTHAINHALTRAFTL